MVEHRKIDIDLLHLCLGPIAIEIEDFEGLTTFDDSHLLVLEIDDLLGVFGNR